VRVANEGDITSDPASDTAEVARASISVEALCWMGLVLAATMLRLADLDGLPLTTDEAMRALDAGRVAGGETPDTWQGDFAAAATSYLFRIFGEHELVARSVAATAGIALVGVLWFARGLIGRVGALVTGALVAFSPLFVVHSRSATAFSVGSFLAVVMVVCLFGYLRNPRTALAFPLVVSLALATVTDSPAVVAALAIVVFLVMEAAFFANEDVRRGWQAFRSSPLQWVSALLVVIAAVQLGITQFGTSLGGELPGIRLFVDMFELPRDSRPPEYHLALLLAYDWSLLLAGGMGFVLLAARLARGGRATVTPFERYLLVWTALAAVILTLVTRREGGQLLMLLLPLAMLAGSLAEKVASEFDWSAAARWWPAAGGIAAFMAMSILLMTEWSTGNAGAGERLLLVAAPLAGLGLIAWVYFRSRGTAGALAVGGVTLMAVAFLVHSSLAVAFAGGTEFAVDARLQARAERLGETLDALAAERGGTIVVDGELFNELGWTLRDSPVVFGGPLEGASAVVTRPDAAPSGFVGLDEVWRVAERWYPDEVLAPRRMWRWLLYREPYGDLDAVDVRIYVRTI